MKRLIFLFVIACALAGCTTTDEPKPVSWDQQQAYLNKVKDPRLYGLAMVQAPGGVRIQGGGRLHYSQADALEMLLEEPQRPMVNLRGRMKEEWPVWIDPTAPNTLFEFETAREMKSQPVAEGSPKLIALPEDDAQYCISLIPSMRLGQVFVENPLVLVRMKNGLPEFAGRGVEKPRARGVVGWDVLRKMEQIQFLYSLGQVVLKTTDSYEPNPNNTLAQIPIEKTVRACAVQGMMDGKPVSVLIDPVGDFEVATPQGGTISTLQLADGFAFSEPAVSVSPGGIRVGARLLERFRVTICPKQGVVYFENRAVAE